MPSTAVQLGAITRASPARARSARPFAAAPGTLLLATDTCIRAYPRRGTVREGATLGVALARLVLAGADGDHVEAVVEGLAAIALRRVRGEPGGAVLL